MAQIQPDEKARLRRHFTAQAIALATQGRWEEAVTANQQIIELAPNDVDAYNRLGKALTELGRYTEARDAYSQAVQHDPNNTIARKNLARLSALSDEQALATPQREKVDPRLFIEETGKTGFTSLVNPAAREVIAKSGAGDQVYLKVEGNSLKVETAAGEYLGEVEPKLALRLISLIAGGNQYAAGITNIDDDQIRIIIKETHQDPSQAGRVSFPTKGGETFRPYTRESLLRYEMEEDEEALEEGEYGEWGEGEVEAAPEEIDRGEDETPSTPRPAASNNGDDFESW